jgi:hypothetical protein
MPYLPAIPSVMLPEGEHLIIPAGALVFYVDDSGDEKLNDPAHPFLAFGGVACTCEFHIPLSDTWKQMKALTFRQVRGPLRANRHQKSVNRAVAGRTCGNECTKLGAVRCRYHRHNSRGASTSRARRTNHGRESVCGHRRRHVGARVVATT